MSQYYYSSMDPTAQCGPSPEQRQRDLDKASAADSRDLKIEIEQVGESDLKITCDAIPVNMAGKALFVRPKERLPYRHFHDILGSLRKMFPETIVVIIPPSLSITAQNKDEAIRDISKILEDVKAMGG